MSNVRPKTVLFHAGSVIQPLAVDEHTAAEMLGVSVRTLWEYRHRGELRHIKFGRLVRYAVDDLRALVAAKREETAIAEGCDLESIKDDAECLALYREAMKGEPGRHKETDNNIIPLDTPQGTSKAYTCERISKVAPELEQCDPEAHEVESHS